MISMLLWRYKKLLGVGVLALTGVVGGAALYNRWAPAEVTTTVVHDVEQAFVNRPVITERIVKQVVADPKQQAVIARLLQENKALGAKVLALTSAVATVDTSGVGPVSPVMPASTDTAGLVWHQFKDWQLSAVFTTKEFHYELHQTYRIVTTTSRAKDGSKVGLVKLYQDTPDGAKEIPITATAVFADDAAARWHVSPRVQGGLGINQDKQKGGVVAVQWLRHGVSNAAEESRWAIGSVGVWFGATDAASNGVVLLPVSFNVGSLPRQPFTNLWVSPVVNSNKHVGVAVTATF